METVEDMVKRVGGKIDVEPTYMHGGVIKTKKGCCIFKLTFLRLAMILVQV